jgi:hypothetical protein
MLHVFSSSHEYAARPTETPGRPISANDRVGRPISAHPPRSLLSAARNPSDAPNSLAFEFYLMELSIEHIMNIVKSKNSATGLRYRCRGESPAHKRLDHDPVGQAAAITLGWTGTGNFLYKRPSLGAQVAQLVEQRTENPCVGGSIPPLGTIGASVVGSTSCSCPAPC